MDEHHYGVHAGYVPTERVDLVAMMERLRADWWDDAACRGRYDEFFPDRRQFGAAVRIREAIATCQTCPVKIECAEAGRDESYGIWGGYLREPTPDRRLTVGYFLKDGDWWSVTDLALMIGRSEAHVRAQVKKLEHRWRIQVRRIGEDVQYRRVSEESS